MKQYGNMQHQTEIAGETIDLFREESHASGFIIREILRTEVPALTFQAGTYVMRPMMLPVYRTRTKNGEVIHQVTHHVEGNNIQKFHLCGFGSTIELALTDASDNLLRQGIAVRKVAFEVSEKVKKENSASDRVGVGEIFREQHRGVYSSFEGVISQEHGVEAYR